MNKLIIIRGNSGSGKTTLATLLHDKYKNNSILISQDVIRRQMLDGDDNKTIEVISNLLNFASKNYDIVILEGIFVKRKYERLFNNIRGIYRPEQTQAYYYDLSFEETVKRHGTRDCKEEFDVKKMRSWFVEKDYLDDFNEIKFNENISINEAISTIESIIK